MTERPAIAFVASFGGTAESEPHDPDSEPEDEHHSTPGPRVQRTRRKQPRRRLQPFRRRSVKRRTRKHPGTMGRPNRPSNAQDRRLVGIKCHHVVDYSTEQDTLESDKIECNPPRRTLDQVCLQLTSSDINQAEKVPEIRKTVQEMGGRHQRILTTNQNRHSHQRSRERDRSIQHYQACTTLPMNWIRGISIFASHESWKSVVASPAYARHC